MAPAGTLLLNVRWSSLRPNIAASLRICINAVRFSSLSVLVSNTWSRLRAGTTQGQTRFSIEASLPTAENTSPSLHVMHLRESNVGKWFEPCRWGTLPLMRTLVA